MKAHLALACLLPAALSPFAYANSNLTTHSSRQILPANFKPPPVFENVNLVRNINLDKFYPKETIHVVIKNIGDKPAGQYFLPFEASQLPNIGGFEVRDKNDAAKGPFVAETVEYDPQSSTQFYRITLPEPLAPQAERTLTISYFTVAALTPLPAKIAQTDQQYLLHTFSAYLPSCYVTSKQKTKLKLPSADVPDFTILPATSKDGITSENTQDPQRQGATFTYGPFSSVPAGVAETVSVRYKHTNPLTHVTLLERDIEVSHWGGNLATEERYWLVNRAAALKGQFSRVAWQQTAYFPQPSSALKGFVLPLRPGTMNPYFVDDIGNISTSRWNPSHGSNKPSTLDLKPRFPIFGDWKYKFKVGWDMDLKSNLRSLKEGNARYVLKVPFLEGPKGPEGIEYVKVALRVILPEGATILNYATTTPGIVASDTGLHRTFMDTQGRTVLSLTALNLNDELRDRDLYVTYEYPFAAGFRKPLTIATATFGVFVVAWLLGNADVRIVGKK